MREKVGGVFWCFGGVEEGSLLLVGWLVAQVGLRALRRLHVGRWE